MSSRAYTPSPRLTFPGPAHIPYEAVTRHLWGDPVAGEVADWIYVSSNKIHQLMFGLPPGGAFRHSEEYRTVFAADEVLYVLNGTMVAANPENGEVQRVPTGGAVFFGTDTWHHAFSYGTEALRVLELFAPPPSQGSSGAYARTRPYLASSTYTQDHLLGHWLPAADEHRGDSIRVVREDDILWRLEGPEQEQPVLVGLLASTAHLTVGTLHLLPGQRSAAHAHGGDESLYLLRGCPSSRRHPNGCGAPSPQATH